MSPRSLVLPFAAVVVGLAAGCGTGDNRAEGIAGSACTHALADELGLADDTGLTTDSVVTEDDGRHHVDGTWHHGRLGNGSYSCDVVPDGDDELRGMRVTAIAIEVGQAQ